MNELNPKLQGLGKTIDVMFGYIKSFEQKFLNLKETSALVAYSAGFFYPLFWNKK
jgi:hypothetical protein